MKLQVMPTSPRLASAHHHLRLPGVVKSTTSAAGFPRRIGALVRRLLVRGWIDGIFAYRAG